MRKITFFAYHNSINYYHIGGLDSFVRRLAGGMRAFGDVLSMVYYGAPADKSERVGGDICQMYFRRFGDAVEYLAGSSDHVISLYILPADRAAYARFRRGQRKQMRFHHLYASWSETYLRRQIHFAEARLLPFNGYILCLSPRLYRYVSSWAKRAALLLPPVPSSFFCRPEDKTGYEALRLTFAGRVDPEKGLRDVLEVFRKVAGRGGIEARIYGYAWSHREATVVSHRELLASNDIIYESADYANWSPIVEEKMRRILRDTDVLLLPYRKLSSTIDTPLLLLEGMASLCAVVTPPLGDLHDIYGPSEFNLPGQWDAGQVVDLLRRARGLLQQERRRLESRHKDCGFREHDVARTLSQLLDR